MRNKMHGLLFLGMILSAGLALGQAATPAPGAPPAGTKAGTVNGTWKITGAVSDHPLVTTCVFTESAGKLTGTCLGTDKKEMPITGTLVDKAVSWSYTTTYDGGDIVLTYTATLDAPNHLAGTVLVDPYSASGDFTATR